MLNISSLDDLNKSVIASPGVTQPKFKKTNVPEFDGDILKFVSVCCLFENLIHNNDVLTNTQKLYYLKISLIESASEIIRDFKLEDRHCAEAPSYSLAGYGNPCKVVKAPFHKLTNLKQIKSDVKVLGLDRSTLLFVN